MAVSGGVRKCDKGEAWLRLQAARQHKSLQLLTPSIVIRISYMENAFL